MEWDEDNFDVNLNGYTRFCYEHKYWAFLSDYVRLYVVARQGGIYLDTDVELVQPLDSFLTQPAFFGWESAPGVELAYVASGLGFGSVAQGEAVLAMLREYDDRLEGSKGVTGCPALNTSALLPLGLQRNGMLQRFAWGTVYPVDYFNPVDSATGVLHRTLNTVSIHWYMGSCLSWKQKIRCAITKPLHRWFGVECLSWLKKVLG